MLVGDFEHVDIDPLLLLSKCTAGLMREGAVQSRLFEAFTRGGGSRVAIVPDSALGNDPAATFSRGD